MRTRSLQAESRYAPVCRFHCSIIVKPHSAEIGLRKLANANLLQDERQQGYISPMRNIWGKFGPHHLVVHIRVVEPLKMLRCETFFADSVAHTLH